MNIRKHWKRLLLTTTALFWASCTSENDNVFPTIGQDMSSAVEPGASSDSNIESSSENAAESSSSENTSGTSSSEASAPSSSSVDESSSSAGPLGPYKLARDSSVTCKDSADFIYGCMGRIGKKSPYEIMNELENNKFNTLKTLEKMEEAIIEEFGEIGLLYGCNFSSIGTKLYKCSNDSIYSQNTHKIRDSLLYSNDEYYEKYYEKPSPLCQKRDFVCSHFPPCYNYNKEFIEDILENDKKTLIDSTKTTAKESLSKQQETCLDSEIEIIFYTYDLTPVATKQICDGDTIVNPRYQAILDTNKAYINKQIDNCLKLKEQESDTEN